MIAFWLLLLAARSHAENPPLQVWHRFDYYQPMGRGQFRLGSRIQVRDRYSTIQQVRISPAIEWPLLAGWSMFGTFRLPVYDYEQHRIHGGRRLLGGVQRGWSMARVDARFRGGVERLFSTGHSHFNRYRTRLTLGKELANWTPYVSEETMLVRDGFHTARIAAGFRHGLNRYWETDLSYQYDIRPGQWGGSRHLLVTRLRFYRNGKD